jgi:cobalamin-dependent methionine synthase I
MGRKKKQKRSDIELAKKIAFQLIKDKINYIEEPIDKQRKKEKKHKLKIIEKELEND